MGKGPAAIESRIADLFAATRDRALSVGEIADHAFQLGGKPATRRSASRRHGRGIGCCGGCAIIDEQANELFYKAHDNVRAAVGATRVGA